MIFNTKNLANLLQKSNNFGTLHGFTECVHSQQFFETLRVQKQKYRPTNVISYYLVTVKSSLCVR